MGGHPAGCCQCRGIRPRSGVKRTLPPARRGGGGLSAAIPPKHRAGRFRAAAGDRDYDSDRAPTAGPSDFLFLSPTFLQTLATTMVPNLNLVAAPLLTMLLAHIGIPQAFLSLATRTLPMPLRISSTSDNANTMSGSYAPNTLPFHWHFPLSRQFPSINNNLCAPTPTGSNCNCVQPSTVIKDYLYNLIAYTYCNGIVFTSATLNSAFIDECTVLYFWKERD